MNDRRTRILDAAVTVIALGGVRRMRVQEVATTANVSQALIYHYFGSREGLLTAALLAVSDFGARSSKGVSDTCSNASEELIALLLNEFNDDHDQRIYYSAWRELRWNAMYEPSLQPTLRRLSGEWVDSIAEVIERAVAAEDGHARVDAQAAAERLVALVEGLCGLWLSGSVGVERLKELLADAVALELRDNGR